MDQSSSGEAPSPGRPAVTSGAAWFVLLAALASGLWQRLAHWEIWPLPFYVMRQFIGALHARVIWLHLRDPSTFSPRESAFFEHFHGEYWYEPPLTELATVGLYFLTGGEDPAISVWVTTAYWMLGGLFLFLASRHLTDNRFAQVAALAFYLCIPFGAVGSRTFQPEPLMIAGFLAGLWFFVSRGYPDTWTKALLAGVFGGLMVLFKPGMMLFALAGTFAGVALRDRRLTELLTDPKFYVAGALLAVPSILWIRVVCPEHISTSLTWQLLATKEFYRSWLTNVHEAVGLHAFCAAVLSGWVLSRAADRWIYAGIMAGYLLFVAARPFHCMTHGYYHMCLVPYVAVLLIPLADRVFRGWQDRPGVFGSWGAAAALLLWIAAVTFAWPTVDNERFMPLTEEEYQAIGAFTGPDAHLVAMSESYARMLRFYGWVNADHWPNPDDRWHIGLVTGEQPAESRQLQEFIDKGATHFVITSFKRAAAEPRTLELLHEESRLVKEKPGRYLIFDLRAPASSSERNLSRHDAKPRPHGFRPRLRPAL